jgi:signal transduction histidine kinase
MRGRILRATVSAVVCAVLLFVVPLAVAVLRLYQQDDMSELRQVADHVAVSVPADARGSGDPIELPRAEPGTRIAVYDGAGLRLTGSGPVRGDGLVRAALAGNAAGRRIGDRLVAAVPVGSGERVRAAVRVSSPAAQPLRRAALAWAGLLALAGVAVAVGVSLSVRSSRRLARPLEALAGTAARLESGDLATGAAMSGVPEADAVAAALNQAAARIDRLLSRERAFSADASHQIRTALATARLELDSALATGTDPYAAMRSATGSLDRVEATLSDLLALARDVPERAPLDLGALFAEVERRWHGRLADAGRPLRVVVDDGVPEAMGSARAARQVLDVLVGNAVEHGAGVVTVRAREAAGALAVDVSDEGPGLPPGRDVFARRGAAAAAGHGIGLALARSLVAADGGRLFVSRRAPCPRLTWLVAADTADGQDGGVTAP